MSKPSARGVRHILPWGPVACWLSLGALTACSGSLPARATHSTASDALNLDTPAETRLDMSTSAELGGLNESEAEQSFRASVDGLQACIKDGMERLAFLGGSIELAVKVDATRRAAHVWAAQSSLGERSTEKCMFDALRSVGWPAPVGGPFGIARNSFEFEPQRGVPTPAVWDPERVATTLTEADSTLSACRGAESGRLLITLYIGEGGKALAGGAASEEPQDEAAVDCVVEALLAAEYPPPERSPTKVRFQL